MLSVPLQLVVFDIIVIVLLQLVVLLDLNVLRFSTDGRYIRLIYVIRFATVGVMFDLKIVLFSLQFVVILDSVY